MRVCRKWTGQPEERPTHSAIASSNGANSAKNASAPTMSSDRLTARCPKDSARGVARKAEGPDDIAVSRTDLDLRTAVESSEKNTLLTFASGYFDV